MCGKVFFIFGLIGFLCVNSNPVSFLKKCKVDDSKCAKESAQLVIPVFAAGIPELGVQRIDPITFKKLNGTSSNLKLLVNDVTVKGLKDCRAKKIQHDIGKSKLYIKLLCDVIHLDGLYEINGQLLIIPVEGKGKLSAVLRKAQFNVDLDLGEITGKDSKTHWDIKDFKFKYELKDKADISLENLFNGNEVLARNAQEVISNISNEIVLEVGPPILNAIASKVIENIGNFFHNVPIEDLTIS